MRPDTETAELFHTTHGRGRPLMLMHGGLGLDHSYFRPWLDPLGDDAELIFYDHRGCGRSPRPARWDDMTHAAWADDADALRARLGHERVVLYGHSYGGILALEYALRHGDRLDGLILCSTVPVYDYPDVIVANVTERGTPEQIETVTSVLFNPIPDDGDDILREAFGTILSLYFRRYDPELGRAIVPAIRYCAAAYNRSMQHCARSYDLRGRLGEIRVPTLILNGRHDWITPPAQAGERLHAGIAASELVIFEESGHFPFIEARERYISTIGEWLRRLG